MTIRFTLRGIFLQFIIAIFCIASTNIIAQGYIAQNLISKTNLKQIQSVDLLQPINVKSVNHNLLKNVSDELFSKAQFFNLNKKSVLKIRKENLDVISVSIPLPEVGEVELNLYRQSIFTSDLHVVTSQGSDLTSIINKTLFYRGVVANIDMSIVSITISDDELSGVISIGANNYNIGKVKGEHEHIIYYEKDLPLVNEFICESPEAGIEEMYPLDNFDPNKTVQCVRLRVEVDHGLTSSLGGNTAALSYVAGLFNEVLTLYSNDNIDLIVSEIFVWEGSSPYSGNATTILDQMDNGTANADLTTLLSTQSGGGVAWLSGLCSSNFGVNFNSVNGSYANVPTYSWDVNVVAHEIGHNLSSKHTHACAWNGNNTAIDGCGPNEGYSEGCTGSNPSSGGTIMSYCHLTSVGVNFNLGFGPQPSQRIRSYIDNSFCLGTSCASGPTCDDGILNGTETDIDCGGSDCPSCPSTNIELTLKTYLQGPFDQVSSLMNDELRSAGHLPLNEPYSGLGFDVPSLSTNIIVLGTTGSDAVVDWILVELRDASDPSFVLASQSALLQRDGDIVNADGEILSFEDIGEAEYFVAIRHRNHMGMRTAVAHSVIGGITINFSDPGTSLFGLDPMYEYGSVRAMYSANANGDGQVNTIDKNLYWAVQNGSMYSYLQSTADFNMDGAINSVDKGAHWRVNNSKAEQLD